MNTFGNIFKLTSFGESHGKGIGGVIDGFPANIEVDINFIQSELDRRRPGQSALTTQRNEADKVEILSGVFNNKTTGTPIGFFVKNRDHHSYDYSNLAEAFRPSHADYTYFSKYGIRDYRGGGRSSARETITRCVAGAFAKLALKKLDISIQAYTQQVGNIKVDKDYKSLDFSEIEKNPVRCPDSAKAKEMENLIKKVREDGDTIGGKITCVIKGCPVGLGEPVFGKLGAALSGAMLSINATKGFEYGGGFDKFKEKGSEQNDLFYFDDKNNIQTKTNNSGGIQGGISNGQDIYFSVAFKPVATILMNQETVDIHGNKTSIKAQGRHDPCVLPRAVPIVESMAAIVILDYYLLSKAKL